MIKKGLLISFAAIISFGLFACLNDSNGPGGSAATPESIVGKWNWNTVSIHVNADINIPSEGLDTTVIKDTTFAATPGCYVDIRGDSTYTVVMDDMMFERVWDNWQLLKKSQTPTGFDTTTGEWWIIGATLYLTEPSEYGTGLDTTEMAATISGNQINFVVIETESWQELGESVSMEIRNTIVATKE